MVSSKEHVFPQYNQILEVFQVLTVCSYHVTYAFQSESTLYSCLNVKELLARNRRVIWSLRDCSWIRTQNHLVCKRTLNHLVKLVFIPFLLFLLYFLGDINILVPKFHLQPYKLQVTFSKRYIDILQIYWVLSIESQCRLNSTAWRPIFSL